MKKNLNTYSPDITKDCTDCGKPKLTPEQQFQLIYGDFFEVPKEITYNPEKFTVKDFDKFIADLEENHISDNQINQDGR